MPKRNDLRIGKRTVDGLSVEGKEAVFWDHDLPGFGVRVYTSGRKVYVVQSRGPRGLKRVTIGEHGELSAEQARKRAAPIIDRIKRGEDPVAAPPKAALTVAGLAERYMARSCGRALQCIYRGDLPGGAQQPHPSRTGGKADQRGESRACRGPALQAPRYTTRGEPDGQDPVEDVLSGGGLGLGAARQEPLPFGAPLQGAASRTISDAGRVPTLGRVLDEAEAAGSVWPPAVAAIRLLMLTGCRRSEILTLRWDDVDRSAGELRLRDSKTGARMVPLTSAAAEVLAGIARVPGNPWVIAGRKPGTRLIHLTDQWYRLRARAGLDDVRLHDLRHSYASRALALGESLTMIGRLLGHNRVATTARYAHLARDTEKISAAKVGDSISAHIMPEHSGTE